VQDVVTHEEIVASVARMGYNHRRALTEVHMSNADEVFDQLWLYRHMLGKNLQVTVQSPFWNKVSGILVKQTLKIVEGSPNTIEGKSAARKEFVEHERVSKFFKKGDAESSEEEGADRRMEQGKWLVKLRPRTRKRFNAAVAKAIRLSKELGTFYKEEEENSKATTALLGTEVADKEAFVQQQQEQEEKALLEVDAQLVSDTDIHLPEEGHGPDGAPVSNLMFEVAVTEG
jgi:hypothetical protein